jgi:hypothetical protein
MRSRVARGTLFVRVCLGFAVILALTNSVRSASQDLAGALAILGADHAQVERELKGPLLPYAQEMERLLSPESCVQLLTPDIDSFREARAKFAPPNASVLGHVLHPRAVRLIADGREGMAGGGCGTLSRYILVWIEPLYPDDAARLTTALEDVRSLPQVEEVSSYTDEQGNRGYVFRVGPEARPAVEAWPVGGATAAAYRRQA